MAYYLRAQHGHVTILSDLIGSSSADIPVGATDCAQNLQTLFLHAGDEIYLALRNGGLIYETTFCSYAHNY